MRHWTDTPCTCGVAKSGIRGAHHDIDCERAKARRDEREALMAKVKKNRSNGERRRSA